MSIANSVDYSQLFQLDDPLSNRPLRLGPIQEWIASDEKVNMLFYGQWQPPEPVIMKGKMGGQVTDVLWSTFPPLLCFSQRVIDLLLDNRITGWSTFPVEVYDRMEKLLPGYYGFAIPGFVGEQDISRSEIITKPAPSEKGKPYTVYKGLFFNESKWDGSDIFRVTASVIIVTRRVRDAFVKAKIKNVEFTPLPEVEVMTFIIDMSRKHRKENRDNTSQ